MSSDELVSQAEAHEVLRSWLIVECFSHNGEASRGDGLMVWQEARNFFSLRAEEQLKAYADEQGLTAHDLQAIARDVAVLGEWAPGPPTDVLPEEEPDWVLAGIDPVKAHFAAAFLRDCASWRGEPSGQDAHLARREARRVIGYRAERALETYARERGLTRRDLENIAHDDAALDEMLAYIKAAQRPGFEPLLPQETFQSQQARVQSG